MSYLLMSVLVNSAVVTGGNSKCVLIIHLPAPFELICVLTTGES